jgi:putative RNA 2'-phosphotransferase
MTAERGSGERDLVADSRFLAYVLRHDPGAIGIELDEGGWVGVDDLLSAVARHGRPLDAARLDRLVAGTGKRRFESAGGRIRAAQGHSIDVDLRLAPAVPPAVLHHGTVARFLPRIRRDGLLPRGRNHVHLSADAGTAAEVGARRGEPVVLRVDAAAMHADGHVFHVAANGVWLTARVPASYLGLPPAG